MPRKAAPVLMRLERGPRVPASAVARGFGAVPTADRLAPAPRDLWSLCAVYLGVCDECHDEHGGNRYTRRRGETTDLCQYVGDRL